MARDFDGVDDALEISSAILTAHPITMAAWFRSTDADADQIIMALSHLTTNNSFHYIRASGGTAGNPIDATSRANSPTSRASTSTGYSANTWHHACGVFAASNDRRVYIDGGSKGTDTGDRDPALDHTSVGMIDFSGGRTNFFIGRIAEAAIWSAALTDNEVAMLAAGVSPTRVRPGSLVGYWPLYGTSSPEPDLSGDGNDLTVTGAVQADHAPVAPAFAFDAPLEFVAAAAGTPVSNAVTSSMEALAAPVAARASSHEALGAPVASRVSSQEALAQTVKAAVSSHEALSSVAQARASSHEAVQEVRRALTSSHEATSSTTAVSNAVTSSMEALGRSVASRRSSQEALAPVVASRASSQEALRSVVKSVRSSHEALGTVRRALTSSDEALGRVARALTSSYESGFAGFVTGVKSFRVPGTHQQQLRVPGTHQQQLRVPGR